MTAPVFVVESLERAAGAAGGEYVLDGPEGRHAVSVKRLRAGEDVVLTDGQGRWAEGVVKAAEGKDRLVVELGAVAEEPLSSPVSPSSRPSPRATAVSSPSRP